MLLRRSYDAIVVGVGSHGSACLYHLAKSGAKVGSCVPPLTAGRHTTSVSI